VARSLLAGFAATLVPALVLRVVPPTASAFMLQRWLEGRTGERPATAIHYRWTPWAQIAPAMRLAVVAAEDQRFPTHHGFDLGAIRLALREGRARPRGASTISQQLARNLFLWPGRSWVRKAAEAYVTVLLEVLWSKRRILEIYLNVAEFGDGVYGVGAAAPLFFGKPPARLAPREAALLAAVLPDPKRLQARAPTPALQGRARWIEAQMRRLGAAYLAEL
jgi:monofunctional biosynthetic peptidoglycan transglycosylase